MTQDGDYIATHSLKDKLTFLIMALASGLLMVLFLTQSGSWFIACLLGAIGIISAVWGYVFFVASVRFSSELIQVRVPPFVNYSRSYADIRTLKEQRGNLRVGFAGGKSLSLPSSLGDAKKIASILARKTDVIPETSRWGR
ncbi:MAG TPA: hypothetical protein VND90_06210 [Terracidiphilus sp.]|nr:hypothetical protein [Terracidiphilus sp.]